MHSSSIDGNPSISNIEELIGAVISFNFPKNNAFQNYCKFTILTKDVATAVSGVSIIRGPRATGAPTYPRLSSGYGHEPMDGMPHVRSLMLLKMRLVDEADAHCISSAQSPPIGVVQ
ncbi:hypothetical protein TNCV_2771901 [Trichonephila clavipes]|nr:hypothetical protein TNCV_2771901 [Trichonephila clavipes]